MANWTKKEDGEKWPTQLLAEDLENAYEHWKLTGKLDTNVRRVLGMPYSTFHSWKSWLQKKFNEMLIRDGMTESDLGKVKRYTIQSFRIDHLRIIETGTFAGFDDITISELCGVSVDTLRRWKRTMPCVKKAYQRGDKLAVADVTHALKKSAIGYSDIEDKVVSYQGNTDIVEVRKVFPPNVHAAKIILLNKSNWIVEPTQGSLNLDDKEVAWDIREQFYEEFDEEEELNGD